MKKKRRLWVGIVVIWVVLSPWTKAGCELTAGSLQIEVKQPSPEGVGISRTADRAGSYRIEGSSDLREWAPVPLSYQTVQEAPALLEWNLPTQLSIESRVEPSHRFYRSRFMPLDRGRLISWSLERELSRTELATLFGFLGVAEEIPVTYDVALYRILYETVSIRGESTEASGAVAIPVGAETSLPVLSYQHGTVIRPDRAPSRFDIDQAASLVLAGMATDGYLAVAADYLGLGESEGPHPYLLTRPAATAVIDMLRASRVLFGELDVAADNRLFLTGYSQGGQVTLATQRAIEERPEHSFSLAASAPMAGPYDLSGTMLDRILEGDPYPNPSFVAYMLSAYQEIYRLFPSLEALFAEPYRAEIGELFDGRHGVSEIDDRLPSVPTQMLAPELVAALRNDPAHPLRLAIRENDLIGWTPQTPTRLYHCADDQVVPKANAEIALEHFESAGAPDVQLTDPMPSAGHSDCFLPSIVAAKAWFDGLR